MNEIINVSYAIKLEVINYPNYIVANNRIFNKKTGVELRLKVYNGIKFYNLNSKKIRADSLKFKKPEDFDCPF